MPEQDLEGLRDEIRNLAENFAIAIEDKKIADAEGCIDDIMRLVQAEVAAARADENKRWKVVAENIVDKHGVYEAVNYLNKRLAELHPPQQPPTEGGSYGNA